MLLAAAVVLESRVGAVKAHAVGLYDQPLDPPEKVRLVCPVAGAKRDVHLRPRKARPVAHTEEHPLQFTARPLGLGMNLIEEQAKSGDPATPSAAPDQPTQGSEIDEAQHLCLGDGLPQLRNGQHRGEIEQGSLDGGTGNSLDDGSIGGPQHPVAVGGNPEGAAAATKRRRDVNGIEPIGSNTPKQSSGLMRENRVRSAGKHGRQQPRLN